MLEKVCPELMVIGPTLLVASIVIAAFVNYASGPFKDALLIIDYVAGVVGFSWLDTYFADKLASRIIEAATEDLEKERGRYNK